MDKKYVYLFEQGNAEMKSLLGGKGANLAEMTNVGLPVPPGFTITTEACNDYYKANQSFTEAMEQQTIAALHELEAHVGKKLGDLNNPLLVSVRSGAVFSMPGMMDTVLNLGLNDETVKGLAELTNNPRFAYDSYRRFIQMFSGVVMDVDLYHFEQVIEAIKEKRGIKDDPQLTAEDWQQVISEYKIIVKKQTGEEFPQNPLEQLKKSIIAVFKSWNNQRAIIYRKIHKIPDHLGTAVNVQSMVFGNMGNDCGTGVAFTRNPSTGENVLYGEYLINAQGEDVVAGIRTPQPIDTLNQVMPEIYKQFEIICKKLEHHYRDMQDIEFTIESGKLYILQTRNGKRTAHAAVKVAYDFVKEDILNKEEALLRIDPNQIDQILHRRIDPNAVQNVIAKGLPASPGAASGKAVFDADIAEKMANDGHKVLLVRPETTPDDIHGIIAAQGILTSRGGMTSHAAVVARGMGKPAICGCEEIKIDLKEKQFMVKDIVVKDGDLISIDGSTGRVIMGEVKLIDPELSSEFKAILEWADEIRDMGVRTNADNPEDARKAREFGAEGIGLCRTEHMFMAADRVPIVQQMILAENEEQRNFALDKLLPMQQGDFEGIFRAMDGLPVTIRLLDPPLHEFLPNIEDLVVEITKLQMDENADKLHLHERESLLRKVRSLAEFNPMLGHRGCRLGVVYPEIYEMQVRAIFKAVIKLHKEGIVIIPEVMIPLVGHINEFKIMRTLVDEIAAEIFVDENSAVEYKVGTMIEVPRAALTADEIAKEADFFSFGTNDLTQTTFGFSRDDAEGKFLHYYVDNKVLPENPFAVLDTEGVGKLVDMAVKLGRSVKPSLKTGICGEHGGEKNSIEFCYQTGLDYVSCSPFRVPIARLSAAQAAIRNKEQSK